MRNSEEETLTKCQSDISRIIVAMTNRSGVSEELIALQGKLEDCGKGSE